MSNELQEDWADSPSDDLWVSYQYLKMQTKIEGKGVPDVSYSVQNALLYATKAELSADADRAWTKLRYGLRVSAELRRLQPDAFSLRLTKHTADQLPAQHLKTLGPAILWTQFVNRRRLNAERELQSDPGTFSLSQQTAGDNPAQPLETICEGPGKEAKALYARSRSALDKASKVSCGDELNLTQWGLDVLPYLEELLAQGHKDKCLGFIKASFPPPPLCGKLETTTFRPFKIALLQVTGDSRHLVFNRGGAPSSRLISCLIAEAGPRRLPRRPFQPRNTR